MSRHPPKELRRAIEAARAVLGDQLRVEHHSNGKHHWRLRCGSSHYTLCGSPQNHEDQRRYARQWAQRQLREKTR